MIEEEGTVNTEEIGRRIRSARQELGISQTELGQLLTRQRTHAAVSDIERGRTKLGVEELAEFARLLGKTLADFVGSESPATVYRRSTAANSAEGRKASDQSIEEFKERARALARQRSKEQDA